MTSFRDKLPDWLAHLSPGRIVVIVVFSIWCGAAGLLVDPLAAVLYAIGFLDILRARGKSRKRRVAAAVWIGVVSLILGPLRDSSVRVLGGGGCLGAAGLAVLARLGEPEVSLSAFALRSAWVAPG